MGRSLRLAICNERFLVRFGVDRLLVRLGEHLVKQGHDVTFFCLRADMGLLSAITDQIEILEGPTQETLLSFDAQVSKTLGQRIRDARFDVCLIGGWPFFQTAADMSMSTVRSAFIDAGAVPHDGFPEIALGIQREICRLRELSLARIDLVMPISAFIRDTQTLPDRGTDNGVHLVLLGADHLSDAAHDHLSEGETALLEMLESMRANGFHLVLALGRIERFGYKNSSAAFDVLLEALKKDVRIKLLILVGAEAFDIPEDMRSHVVPISTISDLALQRVMEMSDLGISPSLWEGFNLPIVEMQWAQRPALAFNIGAHPEVIADPWFLCESTQEMAEKALDIVLRRTPSALRALQTLALASERFTWRKTLERWTTLILEPALVELVDDITEARIVVVDVSNSSRDPANSGVIRVTRRLTAELAKCADLVLLFVKWNAEEKQYNLMSGRDHDFLSSNSGPTDWIGRAHEKTRSSRSLKEILISLVPTGRPRPILFVPEVILDNSAQDRLAWADEHGMDSAFIFHDMLPVFAAEFVSEDVTAAFPDYLAALTKSDAMFANSEFSKREYERWSAIEVLVRPAVREAVWLPAQFSDVPRVREYRVPRSDPIELLCVSTIEPRKNHAVLVEAFRKLLKITDLPLRLNLVGNSYAGQYGLSDWIRSVCAEEPRIVWHGIVDDHTLERLYAQARFTIYPSLAEGFGMPIMESLWLGRPCVCHSGGVMAELAAGGGCLTVDMKSADELVSGMSRLLIGHDVYDRLSRQATERGLTDWMTYGRAIADRLYNLGNQ